MKKIISSILCVLMLVSTTVAFSAEYKIYDNPRQVPASVYQTPFMPDAYTTQYAPWLRNFNMMHPNELKNGGVGGEACQQIESFAISPVNTNIMYFGTDTSSVYKSHTGGEHWYNVHGNMTGWHVQGIVCDVFDENIVYVSQGRSGVFRTRDGAKTWEKILNDPCSLVKGQYYSDKIAQDKLGNTYISVSSGIYKLDRKTDTLTNLTPEYASFVKDQEFKVYDLWVSDDGQKIYASALHSSDVAGGIYLSHDYGKTWKHINLFENEEGKGTAATSITAHPENSDHIFVTAGSYNIEKPKVSVTTPKGAPDTPAELYESTDGGETWTKLYTLYYENGAEGVKKTAKHMYRLSFGPKQDGVYPLYASGNALQYCARVSYDYGRNFKAMHGRIGAGTIREGSNRNGETGYWSQPVCPHPTNPGEVWIAMSGPWKWNNFEMVRKSAGFSGLSITYMDMTKEGKMVFTTTDVGTFQCDGVYTENSYPTFIQCANEIIMTMFAIDPNDSNHIVAFDGNSNTKKTNLGIRESFDGGNSYSEILPGSETTRNTVMFEYDAQNPNIIYSSDATSYDNGKTWKKNEYFLLAVSKKNPDKMLGRKYENEKYNLYYSDDRGQTWSYIAEGRKDYVEVQFDLADDNFLWYSQLQRFGKIDIKNKKIISYNDKFKYKYFHHFAQNPKDPKHMVMSMRAWEHVSYDPSMVESRDGGETWYAIPGYWPVQTQRVYFSKTTDEVFTTGHAGTFIYSYKKYWEFLESKVTVMLNNKEVSFSVMPEITNGRTMVPLREIFELLGATVEWNGETQTVIANRGKQGVTLQIGNDKATVNGAETTLDAPPYIKGGRTLVPLRLVSEALGVRVGWDSKARMVVMKSE